MLARFTKKHFCGGFLHENMAAWLNEETEGLFFLWGEGGTFDVLELCDNERCVLRNLRWGGEWGWGGEKA